MQEDPRFRDARDMIGGIGPNYGGFQGQVFDGGTVNINGPEQPSAEELYERGRAYLDAHDGANALRCIDEAARKGHRPPEAPYHRMLAMLTGKNPATLDDSKYRLLAKAHGITQKQVMDEALQDTTGLILDIVLCAHQDPGAAGNGDRGTLDPRGVLKRLEELRPYAREISDHLEQFLEILSEDEADLAEQEQLPPAVSDGRAKRVPLFFLPDPVLPPPHKNVRTSAADSGERTPFRAAAVVAGAGAAMLLFTVIAGGAWSTLLPWLMGTAGAVIGARAFPEFHWKRERRRHREARWNSRTNAEPGTTSPLADRVNARINYWFQREEPRRDHLGTSTWLADTTAVRRGVVDDLMARFGSEFLDIRAIDWLLVAHARDTADKWRAGTLFTCPPGLRVSAREWLSVVGGGSTAVIGGLWALGGAFTVNAGFALLALVLLATGCWVLAAGLARYQIRRDHNEDARQAQEREAFEHREFVGWRDYLRERRPSDPEMAAWLDRDLRSALHTALRDYGLRRQDTVVSFMIASGVEGSLRARVSGCPMRFLRYEIRLYVLTAEGGVRQSIRPLDFATGTPGVEKRRAFPIRAITSTEVIEVARHVDGRREAITPWAARGGPTGTHPDNVVYALEFVLNLGGDQSERLLLDLRDHMQGPGSAWREVALAASGVASAIRVFENTAAEGSAWLAKQRKHGYQVLRQERQRAEEDDSPGQGTPA